MDKIHRGNNYNGTETNLVTLDKETEKSLDSTYSDKIEERKNKEHEYKCDNDTETNLVTMDTEAKKYPCMTSTAMMEECGNNEHDDNYVYESNVNINDMNVRGSWVPAHQISVQRPQWEDGAGINLFR